MTTLFILVAEAGMDQLATQPMPGVRRATESEIAAFELGWLTAGGEEVLLSRGQSILGRCGRPHWLVAVEETAAPEIKRRACRDRWWSRFDATPTNELQERIIEKMRSSKGPFFVHTRPKDQPDNVE